MNTRRILISLIALPLTGLFAFGQASGPDKTFPAKPNILWLIGEDLGPEALSLSGTPQASTPNLDKLAAQGVYYSHGYAGMVCSVSRSAFMTGMYAISIGAQNHRTRKSEMQSLPDGVKMVTEWMRDAGYLTANIVTLPPNLDFKGTGKTDWNFVRPKNPFDTADWSDLRAKQPFFAQLNFHETHRSFRAPPKADPAKVVLPPYYPDTPVVRKDWAAYLDSATELDRRVGLILKQLEDDGLADSTIVMFFGDNGAAMARAKQFCYEEGFHVPLMIRWPSGFPQPKNFQAGTVDARFIDAIDFAPTTMAFAGIPKPEKMQGRVFLGDHIEAPRDYVFGSRDRCDETVMRIRSVRDARYRYIKNFTPEVPFLAPNKYKQSKYPAWNELKRLNAAGKLTPAQAFLCQPRMPDEELYDLEADPFEINNLAESKKPEHQTALKRLSGVLEKWIKDTNDQGAVVPAQKAKGKGAASASYSGDDE